MPDFSAETRTFVGETATAVGDGWAGFRIGQRYELQVERRSGQVAIVLAHPHMGQARELVVSEAEFEKW